MIMPKICAETHVNVNVKCPLLSKFNQSGYRHYIVVKLPNIEFHKFRSFQVVTHRQVVKLIGTFSHLCVVNAPETDEC
jgi:hypothetical protein